MGLSARAAVAVVAVRLGVRREMGGRYRALRDAVEARSASMTTNTVLVKLVLLEVRVAARFSLESFAWQ